MVIKLVKIFAKYQSSNIIGDCCILACFVDRHIVFVVDFAVIGTVDHLQFFSHQVDHARVSRFKVIRSFSFSLPTSHFRNPTRVNGAIVSSHPNTSQQMGSSDQLSDKAIWGDVLFFLLFACSLVTHVVTLPAVSTYLGNNLANSRTSLLVNTFTHLPGPLPLIRP